MTQLSFDTPPTKELINAAFSFPREPWAYPSETMIELFGSSNGFTKQSAAGTQAQDTTFFFRGDQSLKLTTDGDGSAVFTREASISPTIDLTGKYLKVHVAVSDVSKVSELWLYASSDNFSSAFYTWKISQDISQLKDGELICLTLPIHAADRPEFDVTGTPDRSAINAIQFRVKDDTTGAISAWIDSISSVDEPSNGTVCITFDDGWGSQYTEARKKMDEYGFPGTAYVIPDLVDTSGYMTRAQLHLLQDRGWDISGHYGTTFENLANSEQALESALFNVKNWLASNGFYRGIHEFSYANGYYDSDKILSAVRRYFRSARTIANHPETSPPADPYRLRVLQVLSTTTTTAVQEAVQAARESKSVLFLVYHLIVSTLSGPTTERTIANFGTDMDNLNTQVASGLQVKSVSGFLNGL